MRVALAQSRGGLSRLRALASEASELSDVVRDEQCCMSSIGVLPSLPDWSELTGYHVVIRDLAGKRLSSICKKTYVIQN